MSMAFPGLPPPPPPPEAVVATAVILHRDGPRGREAFLVRRDGARRFAGGWHAFPGGRLDPGDAEVEVAGAAGEAAALVACAVRELFEETGVLLARGRERLDRAAREAARRALLDEGRPLRAILDAHRLALDASLLLPAGRWITPEHLPLRYDARLYVARLPEGESAEVWPGELVDGGFRDVAGALDAWERGELLLHPPNLNALRALRGGEVDLARLRDPPHLAEWISTRIEFQGGFYQAALRTPTLPPATHTNAWLLPAEGGLAVVDPGPPEPAEQAKLFALLDAHAAEGRPPREIWLTHVHADHVGAVAALAARYGLPVRAHRLAAGRAGAEIVPLREGDRVGAGGRFRVLETPGHAREHLAFLDEASGALVCGDLVSTLSTIVIDPPEGDMAEYERQLSRLEALAPRTLYPAHGPPAPDGAGRLAAYRAHRRERERLVVAALAAPGSLAEITARAYADTPSFLHPVAARSCLAVLEKLQTEGRADSSGGIWRGG